MVKKNFWFFLALVAIVIGLGVWAGIVLTGKWMERPAGASPYAAVYMSSGDIYYGKLSWNPAPHLTDVWYLQKTNGENGNFQFAVVPMTGVFWEPSDEITLNPQQIIFWTYLSVGSPVVQAIENPALFERHNASQQSSTPPTATSTQKQ